MLWLKLHSTGRGLFYWHIGLEVEEETSKMLQLEHSFIWCRNMHASCSRSETPGNKQRMAKWIGHILRRTCLLRRVIEGKIKGGIEVTGRRGRRRKKLLDGIKERRGEDTLI